MKTIVFTLCKNCNILITPNFFWCAECEKRILAKDFSTYKIDTTIIPTELCEKDKKYTIVKLSILSPEQIACVINSRNI